MSGVSYDGYYEAEANAAAAEAEAMHRIEYENFLSGLLEKGQPALFAAYVAIDWLNSKEFSESGMSAKDFIRKMKDEIEEDLK